MIKLFLSMSLREILMRILYFFKKFLGYYKRIKPPVSTQKMTTLNLLNKEQIKALEIKTSSFDYNFLNNYFNITSLKFTKAKKIWIYEKLSTYGDIKNEWEINRLQFLFPLAIKYYQTDDRKLLDLIKKTIDNWKRANPYNYGVNWYSNLEVAIRAVTLYFVYELTNLDLSNTLYEHGTHLFQEIKYSEYCIPNNHVYGEATALLLLGKAFLKSEWILKAKKMIKKFSYLINDEGVGIEGSFSYSFFLTQMLLLQTLLLNHPNNKLGKAFTFLYGCIKPNGKLANLGDNDDGFFFNPFWEKDILKTIDNIDIFNLKDQLKKTEKTFYNYRDYKIIKKEGFYLLFNGQEEKYHSHSDALSIELTIDYHNIFEDSGTYLYNGNQALRQYFRSSLAHNTIAFNGLDHSIQVGTFRWLKSKKATLCGDSEKLIGLLKCRSGKFKRTILIEKNKVIIIDDIIAKGFAYLNFHFGLDLQVTRESYHQFKVNNLLITFNGCCEIKTSESLISQSYNKISKRTNIRIKTVGNTTLETIISQE